MAWTEPHGAGWRVRYYLDGELITETGFATKTAARERADDVSYEKRKDICADPRKGRTTFAEWSDIWCDAHDVSATTWAKYRSHLRNYILPKFGSTPLEDITRMKIKSWVKTLRRQLSDATVSDVVTLLSMMLGDASDEGYLGKNPCRRLRLNLQRSAPKQTATAVTVSRIASRFPEHRALILTAAYSGMRWGELAGLQWHNVDLEAATLTVDPDKGALHEVDGRLELGPPKTPASARTIHLPPFHVDLLRAHRAGQHHDHVFTGPRGGLLRRANFRDRIWQPAVAGHRTRGWAPLQPGLTFHYLRHTHKTWLREDGVDQALQHERLGHRMRGVDGIYSHVTQAMIDRMLAALEDRWQRTQHALGDTGRTDG